MSSVVITGSESVGLPLDEAWVVFLEQKLAETDWEPWRTDNASIFRGPLYIRDDDAKLYDPKVVSLGLFNKLCSGAAIDDGNGDLASVFGNPWSAFALMAAFLLFGLTSTQTVYTVLAYVRPRRN